MYKSKYNYIYKRENDWCFYNTLTGSVCLLDETHKKMYDKFNFKNENEFLNDMIKNGFIRHNEYDEESIVNFSRARRCLNENSMYLRILTTTSCNARCEYCYEKGMKKQNMTLKVAEQISKFILKQPKKEKVYIHWFGGEPLLNVKVIDRVMSDIYDHLKNNGTQVFVYFTSNGSILDKELAKIAKQKWHANQFQITIDDLGEKYNEIKNYINKKYDFNRVIDNIGFLLENEISVILRINYIPSETQKVKKIIDFIYNKFEKYCDNKLLVFSPAPIFNSNLNGNLKDCVSLKKLNVYNMLEPNIYLINKGLLSVEDGMDLKYKGGSCYACHQGSFVINPKGELFKCTVAINDSKAKVGDVYNGIDRNRTYFKWITPVLPKKCNKCKFLPICQGGCRAGHMGYMNVACKRNVSEIKSILNYRIGTK